jgi:hypothetical protein
MPFGVAVIAYYIGMRCCFNTVIRRETGYLMNSALKRPDVDMGPSKLRRWAHEY